MPRRWECSLLAGTAGCSSHAVGSGPPSPWLLVAVPVVVTLLAWVVRRRPTFLDTMVRVQQRRMRRLLLALEKAAAEGVDLGADWYEDRTRLIERYVGLPTEGMPGPTSLVRAHVRAIAQRAGSTPRTPSERDFDAQLLLLVVRAARYQSLGLWLLPAGAWTWWARRLATRHEPGWILESVERDRARASHGHRKYPRRGPEVSLVSDPGVQEPWGR